MSYLRYFLFLLLSLLSSIVSADSILIAAASDMKFVMQDIVKGFNETYPDIQVNVSTGSSGKFYAHIKHGAPYDLYFSADIIYPQRLALSGHAASDVITYAKGRLVLLSGKYDVSQTNLQSLEDEQFQRLAMASPKHAPYGVRAKEALVHIGGWRQLSDKFVFGDSVSHAAQLVVNRHVDAGIVALSLVKGPHLPDGMSYRILPESLHEPLMQGFIVTRHGQDNQAAWLFKDFMQKQMVTDMYRRYGFSVPTTTAN